MHKTQENIDERLKWVQKFIQMRCPSYLNSHADDICQEVMIKLLRAQTRNPESELNKSYIKRTVMSVMIDVIRKHSRLSESELDYEIIDHKQGQPDTQAENKSILHCIQSILETFPTRKKEILLLYFRGIGVKEIQDLTGLNIPVIRNEIYRGRSLLAEQLQKKGYSYEING
ncbi:MAG: RNA polymerase sigma factor [bacterium]